MYSNILSRLLLNFEQEIEPAKLDRHILQVWCWKWIQSELPHLVHIQLQV